MCIQKVEPARQRVMVDADKCTHCGACLICPGLAVDENGIPHVTNLCSGCAGHTPACVQMCPTGVLHAVDLQDLHLPAAPVYTEPPRMQDILALAAADLPERLSVAIRGVGGQGNLFFGSVLAQLALLAGYAEKNIIKGETHGMAQMGGPVISTFSCGQGVSRVLLPGSADCLIVMEKSEVLRPGFLDMLKPGGMVLMATTRIIPLGMKEELYPADAQIDAALSDFRMLKMDVLGKAMELGDASGRSANVVMMGALSTLPPFNVFPAELWLQALQRANSRPMVWAANYVAFNAGRQLGASVFDQAVV